MEEEEEEIWAYDLRWLLDERIQWPVHDLQTGCNRTMALIASKVSLGTPWLDLSTRCCNKPLVLAVPSKVGQLVRRKFCTVCSYP